MKQKIIKLGLLLALVLGFALLPALASPLSVTAVDEASRRAACDGIGAVGGKCDEGNSVVGGLVVDVVQILSWVVGVASIIMIIVGGLKYIMSNGDSNGMSSAKNTVLYAVIGLVIALMAQIIIRFVIHRVTPDNPFAP